MVSFKRGFKLSRILMLSDMSRLYSDIDLKLRNLGFLLRNLVHL